MRIATNPNWRRSWIVLVLALAPAFSRSARAEIVLGNEGGWNVSTDGRVNTFISVARGTGIPAGQADRAGAGTKDTMDKDNNISAIRVRNGFMTSILGMTVRKEVSPNFKVSARVGLWMNLGGSRTKNTPGLIDPRELYGKIEGNWGSVLAGSDLALFGRGGIMVDALIAHDYGMGYPCLIENASGGACGMAAFGAIFPGFEPGFVYTTPSVIGLQLALGAYDPATIASGQLNRASQPRWEAELSYGFRQKLRIFASGFWQVMEGTIPDPAGPIGTQKDLHVNAWGGQAGFMLVLGPVMLGGAAFEGAGLSPITHVDEHQTSSDGDGVLRRSRGAFGMGAFTISAIRLKIAGGAGIFHVDKTKNDPDAINSLGAGQNPQVLKQNVGGTLGLYQWTGPVQFALEYFRAEHIWYEYGQAHPDNPNLVDIKRPQQAVNFINAGMTVVW
jgi:hypothetical protein